MMNRVLSLGAALAVVVFVGAVVAADKPAAPDKSNSAITGTLSSVAADSITVTDKDGKDHKLTVDKDATAPATARNAPWPTSRRAFR